MIESSSQVASRDNNTDKFCVLRCDSEQCIDRVNSHDRKQFSPFPRDEQRTHLRLFSAAI